MIQIRKLRVSFGEQMVLEDVDLEIKKSHTQVLLGESGSGKTTLLRVLMGLVPFQKGEVSFFGEELIKTSGYVVQEGGLFPHLGVKDNITLRAKHQSWSPKDIGVRLEELLDLVKLEPSILDRFPAEISGGQRQRVSLIRALFCRPQILLMDEPLGALDPITRFDLQNDLRDLFQRLKITVVLVTHDLAEAFYLGDSIAMLNKGKIEQVGEARDFLNTPGSDYVKKFVGSQRWSE